MTTLVTLIHIIVCLILILAVLLQSGKSADLAGAFGGAGSQTAFGPRGSATLLSKITTASAIIFMFTSLGMWILSAKGTKSVVSGEQAPKTEVPAAAQPATTPPTAQPAEKKDQSAAQTQPAPKKESEPNKAETKPATNEPEKKK